MTTTQPATPTLLTIHTDGGSRGNPGPAATGIVIFDDTNNAIHRFGQFLGVTTNNVAEYTAVLHALNWVISNPQTIKSPTKILFKLDSKLVVEQLSGNWRIKDPNLASLANQIKDLTSNFHLLTSYSYVPRAQNAEADAEVNKALDNQINIDKSI